MAQDKTEQITCGDLSLTRGNVRVELEFIGEGDCGDHSPEDPDDEPLLRFTILGLRKRADGKGRGLRCDDGLEGGAEGEWAPFYDACYCTQLPATLPEAEQRKALRYLMDEVFDRARDGQPIKKLCERLSWISTDWINPKPKPAQAI
jgi:hypothetical protein